MYKKILFCSLFILICPITWKQDANATTWERGDTTVAAESILTAIDRGDSIIIDSCEILGSLTKEGVPGRPDTIKSFIRIYRSTFSDSVSFKYSHFMNEVIFWKDTFMRNVTLYSTTFGEEVVFVEVSFDRSVSFRWAKFHGVVDFYDATFGGYADFYVATFDRRASFWRAKFHGDACFSDATFGVDGNADFLNATFDSSTFFERTKFHSDVFFNGSTFGGYADFAYATFGGYASFPVVTFDSSASFYSAKFHGDANFFVDSIGGGVNFMHATFDSSVSFSWAKFHGYANFAATFSGYAEFHHVTFDTSAYFSSATFDGVASFNSATFGIDADFRYATFGREVDLSFIEFKNIGILWQQLKGHLICDPHVAYKLKKHFEEKRMLDDEDGVYLFLKKNETSNMKWYKSSKYWGYLMWVTCGYGVMPGYTILWSIGIIVLFALFFRKSNAIKEIEVEFGSPRKRRRFRIEAKRSKKRFLDALYFSFHTFIVGVVSDRYPTDEFLIGNSKKRGIKLFRFRTLSMIEGALGWILVILFIASLGKKFIR